MRHLESFYPRPAMSLSKPIYLGIDSGATTCKVNAVDARGQPMSRLVRQYPTRSSDGREALLQGWMDAAERFLREEDLTWEAVAGIGLAMPGPFMGYGVLGKLLNYPNSFCGWHYLEDFSRTVHEATGRVIPVCTANDGHLAGLAEASLIQSEADGSVFLLAPGSGLGSAFVDADGIMLEGDHISAGFFCCMPTPYAELGLPKLSCSCGRDWGCLEAYTSLSGLPQLIRAVLPRYPLHAFHDSGLSPREQALQLRGRAKDKDPLAIEVFQLQAKAMGYAVAMASMAYDPSHIVIGGGLMDPEATSESFRRDYIATIRETASPYLWIDADALDFREAQLGELSQAIGAALLARQQVGD